MTAANQWICILLPFPPLSTKKDKKSWYLSMIINNSTLLINNSDPLLLNFSYQDKLQILFKKWKHYPHRTPNSLLIWVISMKRMKKIWKVSKLKPKKISTLTVSRLMSSSEIKESMKCAKASTLHLIHRNTPRICFHISLQQLPQQMNLP